MKEKMIYINILFFIIGAGIFIYLIYQMDLNYLFKTMGTIGLVSVLLFVPLIIQNYLRAFRFQILIASVKKVPLMGIFSIIFETMIFTTYSPGKIGELMKLQLLKERYDVPRRNSAGILVIERTFDIIIIILFSAGIIYLFGELISWTYTVLVLVGGILLTTASIMYIKKYNILSEYINPFESTIKDLFKSKTTLIAFALTPFVWAAEAVVPYGILHFLNYQISFILVLEIYYVGTLIGLLSLIPGAVGSLDISIFYLLTNLASVSENDAIVAVLLIRGISIILHATGFGLYSIRPYLKILKKINSKTGE